MGETHLRPTLEKVLATESVLAYARTIETAPRQTIEPSRPALQSHDSLERFLAPLRSVGPRFVVHGLLGEGGMGKVHRADQRALGREVAVKTLRDERVDPEAIRKLLQEAWVTGRLEHPNVVPVHDIHLDEQGLPQIVLKRIEGLAWEALMRDASLITRRFAVDAPLEWNLRILVEVCNVVAFAHSRGIIHRDLKPENVMVGDYGEVYVVDWGLAVGLEPDPQGMLPTVAEATELAGTPCYMAPEMLGGAGALSPRTDVYLLGAILYEILTGVPPHDGETFQQIVAAIVRSSPPMPKHAPPELARICQRAMDPDPDGRFESVHQLRMAIAGFQRHQGSRRLSADASARHLELERRLREAPEVLSPAEQRELDGLFGECRFGYRAALEAWPENEAAARGLRDVTVRLTQLHLAQGQPRVAASVLGGLADPPVDLVAQVEAAVAAHDASRAALERLGQELDPHIGRRTRTFLGLILGSMWTVTPLLHPLLEERDPDGAFGLVVMPLFFLALGVGLVVWARESMTKTAINRFVASAVGLTLAAEVLLMLGAYHLEVPVEAAHALTFVLWSMAAALIGIVADMRILAAAGGYAVGFLVSVLFPELRWWVTSASHAFTTLVVLAFWAPQGIDALRGALAGRS